MPLFRYTARDANGQRVQGEFEAASPADAERWLREWGLEPLEITQAGAADTAEPARLTRGESERVLVHVADLSSADLPLPAGLRAAAAEAHGRVARALRSVASDLERGESLDSVLQRRARQLPPHVYGLILAAARTRRLGPALDELIAHQQSDRETAWSIAGAVSYPLLVLAITFGVLSFLPIFLVPQFKRMFAEFELQLPVTTQMLIHVSDALRWLLPHVVVWLVPLLLLVLALSLGSGIFGTWFGAPVRRLLHTMPLLGPLWQWSAAARFARVLAMLVEQGVPLGEALRMTGDSLADSAVKADCYAMSLAVEEGRSLSSELTLSAALPATLAPLVRWGEKSGDLPDALRSASDLFRDRIQLRAMLLRSIAPPLVFVVIAAGVGYTILSLFLPLISLIQGLS